MGTASLIGITLVICLRSFCLAVKSKKYYAPGNVSIVYWSDNGDMQEGNGYISITCYADCNPECDRYFIYHNHRRYQTKEKRIIKDRTNSGLYKCEALNSLGRSVSNTTNISIHYLTVILESNKKELAINISDILPRDVSCRIDCNFPGCDSNIRVKRDSQFYRTIRSRESIFENRAVERSDGGTYVCMVGTRVSGNNFKLIIYHGPKTTSVLRNYQTIVGDIIEKEDPSMAIPLRCWSSCNPSCEVAWYKDRQLESRGNPVIEITRDRRMSGVYHCEASGVEGKVKSDQVNVTIQYPPGDVTITPGDDTIYTKLYGTPLHNITCEADCVPECSYWWYREGYPYTYTTGNKLFATRSYYYRSSSRFRCLASNAIKPYGNYSRWITVEVKEGPDNVTIIPSLPAIENKSFTLTCSASCYHGCQSYSWYHDGRSINQSTTVLGFQRLSKEDSGRYRCQVTDYFGEKLGNYTVNVQYDPKYVRIHYWSSYEHLIEGQDRLTITCDADCQPMCTYLFYQNEKLLYKEYVQEVVHRNMSGRYTCAAKNSLMNTYRNSSNIQNIKIKYKPMITSTKNQTTMTAPDLLDLTFSVDSFPSSNVTIFHETKTLTFLPNVTGQLSFNVSVKSCLVRGEYRVEAVNDVGSDNFNFMPNIKCSPIVVRYSNVAHKEFRVGHLLHLTVSFMANPTAEVQWSFLPWNQNTSREVQPQQIQTHKESTKLVLILSDTNKFGKYILELKNELGKISKEFNIQGPIVATTKTDPGTTISSRDSDSDGDLSMSPTSWKGKTNALRETEMNTFLLQQDKLHEEVQKLRLEGDVLRLKRNYYVIKLQVLIKEHPDIIDEVFGED